jgi:hypothetical protein
MRRDTISGSSVPILRPAIAADVRPKHNTRKRRSAMDGIAGPIDPQMDAGRTTIRFAVGGSIFVAPVPRS